MKPYQQRPMDEARLKWRRFGPLHVITHGLYAALEITIGGGERWVSVFVHSRRALLELEVWGVARFWPLSAKVKIGKYAL